MDIDQPTPLLAGLSPAQFMRQHWQKKPLLVRNTGLDYFTLDPLPLDADALLDLAAQEQVQSRAVLQRPATGKGRLATPSYQLLHGPFDAANPLPQGPCAPGVSWSVLVQGVDTHHTPTHALLQQFRFVPDARLDDVMVSLASKGGGVGPHFDSYDVFLLQVRGQREWRIGPQRDLSLREGLPLKILRHFEPTQTHVLNPGDMLYLPPKWAHDGVALADGCMTFSIGFRAPSKGEMLKELLHRVIDQLDDEDNVGLAQRMAARYADGDQCATATPGKVPQGLQEFAIKLIASELLNTMANTEKALEKSSAKAGGSGKGPFADKNLACTLGEWLSEPNNAHADPEVIVPRWTPARGVTLCARTRMLYDDHHLFVNGQSWRAAGADARLMRTLADTRTLTALQLKSASEGALGLLKSWLAQGWLQLNPKGSP